jgi:hypothetical protein
MLPKLWNWFRRLFGVGIRKEVYNPCTGESQELPSWVIIFKYSSNIISWVFTILAIVCFMCGLFFVGTILQALSFVLIVISVAVYYFQTWLWYMATLFEFIKLSFNRVVSLLKGENNVEYITEG